MSLHSPDLRFGVSVDGRRSYTWRVRAGAKKADMYVERENLPRVTHVSLHESGNWYVRADRKRDIHKWARPGEFVPGYTRALAIVQPPVVAHLHTEPPPGTVLLPTEEDADPTTFSLFIERPGTNLSGWPGKTAMGTKLVGRLTLAGNVGTCCIVAHREPIPPGSHTFTRPSDAELARMREAAAAGKRYGTLVGDLSDGAVLLMDGKVAPDAIPAPAAGV